MPREQLGSTRHPTCGACGSSSRAARNSHHLPPHSLSIKQPRTTGASGLSYGISEQWSLAAGAPSKVRVPPAGDIPDLVFLSLPSTSRSQSPKQHELGRHFMASVATSHQHLWSRSAARSKHLRAVTPRSPRPAAPTHPRIPPCPGLSAPKGPAAGFITFKHSKGGRAEPRSRKRMCW